MKFNAKVLGVKQWNGQEAAIFEKSFYVALNNFRGWDTAQIFADQTKV